MRQKSKVAVIGLGNIGATVANNLVKGNRSVIGADRTVEKANNGYSGDAGPSVGFI